MNRVPLALTLITLLLGTSVSTAADAPQLLRSEPADGATGVPIDFGVLRLHFDQDMRTDSFTVWKSDVADFPPPVKNEANPRWLDARTFELTLQPLKPGMQYAVQLNSDQRQGFTSAGNKPLAVTTIRFTTAAAAARQDIYDPAANDQQPPARRQDLFDPAAEDARQPSQPPARPGGVLLKWNARPGQASELSTAYRTLLELQIATDSEQGSRTIDQFIKARQHEEILAATDGRPTRLNCRIDLAQMMTKDPNTGEVTRQDLPVAGLDMDLAVADNGSMRLEQVKRGDRSLAEELAGELAWCSLLPDRVVSVGESWKLEGQALQMALNALDAQSGEIEMRLVKLEQDPAMKLDVAHIEGRFRGNVLALGELPAEAEGQLTVKFVPDVGLPFLRKMELKLRVNHTQRDEWQSYRITGTGSIDWVEERALSDGTPPPAPTPPQPQTRFQPASDRPAQPASAAGTVAFHRVAEPNENAFTMLIPVGWRVVGGIVRVDAATTGAAAQAIAAKVNMQIRKDDAGTVLLHFIPSILYVDNRGAPAAGSFPQGTMMNGMPVLYKMSAENYLAQVVFPQLRPYAQDVRIIDQRKLPSLAAGYKQRMASIPILGGQFNFDAATVTFEYTEGGTRYRERMLTILRDYGQIGAGMWDNNETVTGRAPADEFERWEPVAFTVMSSVRLNSQWLAGEIRGQMIRSGIYEDTNRLIRQIDQQMTEHRQKTYAEINNDAYLTLMGQEEYVNPYTKEVEIDSGYWKHRWTTESGDILFTNDESYDPNTDPHCPINRTDFKRCVVRPRGP